MATSDDEWTKLLPEEWRSEANDLFAFFSVGKYWILQTTQDVWKLERNAIGPPDATLLIYAETVEISDDLIDLESRKIILCCNTINIPKDAAVTLRVSGRNGADPVLGRDVGPEANGTDAGSLTLYIENMTPELVPRHGPDGKALGLHIVAVGGDGGRGQDSLTGKGKPGGNGGKGGNVNVYCGFESSRDHDALQLFMSSKTIGWPDKIHRLEKFKHNEQISENVVKSLKDVLSLYTKLETSINQIRERFDAISLRGAPNEAALQTAKVQTLAKLDEFTKSPHEPMLTDELTQNVLNCYKSLEDLRKSSAAIKDKPWDPYLLTSQALVQTLTDTMAKPVNSDHPTPLNAAYIELVQSIVGQIIENTVSMKSSYSTEGGKGGIGGKGNEFEAGYGAKGKQGADGEIIVEVQWFRQETPNLEIQHPLVSPDQCQMLMNRADLAYFLSGYSKGQDHKEAIEMYQKLNRRLSFVPKMIESIKQNKTPPLAEAYAKLEKDNLTRNPIWQLSAMQTRVSVCIDKIAAGFDIFGHAANWVPRQSYPFYRSKVDEQITRIDELETQLQHYGSDSTPGIDTALQNVTKQLRDLEIRIKLLTGDNGQLRAAGFEIEAYTPDLKRARTQITETIKAIEEDLKNKTNFSPKDILDALSMIATAPTSLMTGVQTLQELDKANSTLPSSDGTSVDKRYVVGQFIKIENSLSGLVEGYRHRSDGNIDVDDPGADKIMTTKSNLEELLAKFEQNIADDHKKNVEKELNAYVELIRKRNDAVLKYNSAVKQLVEAESQRTLYEKQKESYGGAKLRLDSNMPAGRLFMRQMINHARLAALDGLTSGSRAIGFWALKDSNELDKPLEKPFEGLPASETLKEQNAILNSEFMQCLEEYGNGQIYNLFPGQIEREGNRRQGHGQGWTHLLEDNEVEAFRTVNTANLHEVNFVVPVATSGSNKDETNFAGWWDVRLDQARVWIYGAKVGTDRDNRRELRVHLTRYGEDNINRYNKSGVEQDKVFDFSHDRVPITFSYDPQNIVDFTSARKAEIYSDEKFPGVFRGQKVEATVDSLAPMGPFGDWRLSLDPKFHIKLDLSEMTGICVEFWGSAAAVVR